MTKHHYHARHRNHPNGYLLSFLGGIEGGFGVFVGIVAGLSFANVSREVLIVTALVGIIVSAINAATIRYSTEHYLDEVDGHEKRSAFKSYLLPSVTEFIVYVLVSLLALIPLLLIPSLSLAVGVMIISCLTILFVAGAIRGHLLIERYWLRDGLEVMFGGAIMVSVGLLAGWLLVSAFGAYR